MQKTKVVGSIPTLTTIKVNTFAIHIKNKAHYYKCRNYLIELKLIKKNRYLGRLEDILGSYLVVKDDFVSIRKNKELIVKQNIPIIIYPVDQRPITNRLPRKIIKEHSLPLLSSLKITYKEIFEGLGYKVNSFYRIRNKDGILNTFEKVLERQRKIF